MNNYIFKTERLGIRNWEEKDIPVFVEMGKDQEVMKFFPALLTESQSLNLIKRMQNSYEEKKYGYLPVEILETQEFIGMIGIADQNYLENPSQFIDIGWRLKKSAWGSGFATEGAKGWLKYSFENLGLKNLYSVAPLLNLNSENVMKKLGFEKIREFKHPKIAAESPLQTCSLYLLEKQNFQI